VRQVLSNLVNFGLLTITMACLGVQGGVISITKSLPIIHVILYVKIFSKYNGMEEISKDLLTFGRTLVWLIPRWRRFFGSSAFQNPTEDRRKQTEKAEMGSCVASAPRSGR